MVIVLFFIISLYAIFLFCFIGCMKLNKCLYGLKQSAKCWNELLDRHFLESGYTRADADGCLYIKTVDESCVIMGVYVDDFIPISNDIELMKAEKAALHSKFEVVIMET